jgi:subtilisin family serine protease
VIAASLAAIGGGATVPASGPGLCGLTRVTDHLLNCTTSEQQAKPAQTQSAQTQSAQSSPRVARTGPVITTPIAAQYVADSAIVRFARSATTAQSSRLLARIGATRVRTIGDLHTVEIKVAHGTLARSLATLNRSQLVAVATRDELLHILTAPNDANYSLQWGLPLAGFPAAWLKTHGSRAVTVAVLDTGVNGAVPDLAGNVKPGIDLTGSGLTDVDGHGTAVAGVIAAHANNSLGGAGVCPNCSILPVKVMGNDGTGSLATVAQGITRAADQHAKVIDLSLGGPVGFDALKQAVDYATAKGSIVVAAAGNSGKGAPYYPANYPNVLGVAGTNQGDRLYTWSERGTWVQVAAPGCNVAPLAKGGYGMFCGTSAATPLVAGLAALAVAYRPHAGVARIESAIETTARKIGPSAGHGRINAAAALAALH